MNVGDIFKGLDLLKDLSGKGKSLRSYLYETYGKPSLRKGGRVSKPTKTKNKRTKKKTKK